jgi:hypothetical protein
MRQEKIIKRNDGSRVKIITTVQELYGNIVYRTSVYYCESGKRLWRSNFSTDDYCYRKLSNDERQIFIENKNLEYATREEIHAEKLAIWELIKPKELA